MPTSCAQSGSLVAAWKKVLVCAGLRGETILLVQNIPYALHGKAGAQRVDTDSLSLVRVRDYGFNQRLTLLECLMSFALLASLRSRQQPATEQANVFDAYLQLEAAASFTETVSPMCFNRASYACSKAMRLPACLNPIHLNLRDRGNM